MSPGYLPFKDALQLPAFVCDNCGWWQRHFETPASCPLCHDARHVVPHLLTRRHDVTDVAGETVELDDLRGRDLDTEVLTEATRRLMAAILELLCEIRGERPGAPPLDTG